MLSKRVEAGAEAMAEDHAQEALLKILDKLNTFRSESKFTTWAHVVLGSLPHPFPHAALDVLQHNQLMRLAATEPLG